MKYTKRTSNNFGFLRICAALSVVYAHLSLWDKGVLYGTFIQVSDSYRVGYGTLGVFAFFIMSGFLVSMSWVRNEKVCYFLANRILRIYPAFIVNSLLTVVFIGVLIAPAAMPHFWEKIGNEFGGFISGLIFLQLNGVPTPFTNGGHAKINGSLWTLLLEFYANSLSKPILQQH